MSISSTWKRLTQRFRTPTLAEAQVHDRKTALDMITECRQMIRHNEYMLAIALAELDAIDNFEKEQKNGHPVRVA